MPDVTTDDLAQRVALLEKGHIPRPSYADTWPLRDPVPSANQALRDAQWRERQRVLREAEDERRRHAEEVARHDRERADMAATLRRRGNAPRIFTIDKRLAELRDTRRPLVEQLVPVEREIRSLTAERLGLA
jgi:hypothetical protein